MIFWQGARAYDGKPYSDTVCWDLQCHDPNRDNWCLSTKADDRTSCGYNKVTLANAYCLHVIHIHKNAREEFRTVVYDRKSLVKRWSEGQCRLFIISEQHCAFNYRIVWVLPLVFTQSAWKKEFEQIQSDKDWKSNYF